MGERWLDRRKAPEAGVEAARLEELGMRAFLDHAPLVQDDDAVRLLGDAESMGHDEGGPPRHRALKRAQDLGFLARIHGGEDVVEHEDGGRGYEGAGERRALALSARQRQP